MDIYAQKSFKMKIECHADTNHTGNMSILSFCRNITDMGMLKMEG